MKPTLATWLLLGSALLLGLLLAPVGLGDTDQGYLLGLGWRIFQGERLYLDIDYVRPPLSPWLHSLWFHMGKGWDLWAGRMSMYLALAAAVIWQAGFLRKEMPDRPLPAALTVLALLLALHNFPAMPWHTIDGIFFASLGLWGISRSLRGWQLLGWLSICAAVLTKQSFAPMLPLALAWLWLGRSRRQASGQSLLLLLSLTALGLLALTAAPGFWSAAWSSLRGASSGGGLWQAGVISYAKPLLVAAGIAAGQVLLRRRGLPAWADWLPAMALLALLLLWISQIAVSGSYQGPPARLAHTFWWLALWQAGRMLANGYPGAYAWMVLLGLGWCSSLSWGYVTPILVALPWLWSLLPAQRLPQWPWWMAATAIVATLIVLSPLLAPYREQRPTHRKLTQLRTDFPRLRYLQAGPEIGDELLELQTLRQQYPGAFTVLPNWPLIHALTHTRNPLPIDWAHNAEMTALPHSPRYLLPLAACEAIFIDRDHLDEAEDPSRYGSLLTGLVRARGRLLTETSHWEVWTLRP